MIAVISALVLWGSEGAAKDELIFRGTAIGFALAIFPLLYVWNFVSVPAKFDAEQNETITKLAKGVTNSALLLTKKKSDENQVKTLCVLLERLHDLIMKKISPEEYSDWLAEYEKLGIVTLKYLATAFSHQEAISFKYVHYTKKLNYTFKVNEEHNKKIGLATERISVLNKIIESHKDSWTPISSQERARINENLKIFEVQALTADGSQTLNEESG